MKKRDEWTSREGCIIDAEGRVSDADFHAEMLGDHKPLEMDLPHLIAVAVAAGFTPEEAERFWRGDLRQKP